MPRIDLIPEITTDGRHVILRGVPVTPRDRLRRLLERLKPRRTPKRD